MSYGVIAIIHISCVPPECDESHFNGWWANLLDANVFELFKKRYPEADVFIVEQRTAEWRQIIGKQPDDVIDKIIEQHDLRCKHTNT
jgi:hypothetical protein